MSLLSNVKKIDEKEKFDTLIADCFERLPTAREKVFYQVLARLPLSFDVIQRTNQ